MQTSDKINANEGVPSGHWNRCKYFMSNNDKKNTNKSISAVLRSNLPYNPGGWNKSAGIK